MKLFKQVLEVLQQITDPGWNILFLMGLVMGFLIALRLGVGP